jgi:hypothetical protein
VLGYRTTRLKNRAQVGSITGPLLYSFVDLKLKEKYSSPYTWGSLKMVLSLCPSLLKVHITTIAGLRNADLLSLISVERLCEQNTGVYGYFFELTTPRCRRYDPRQPLARAVFSRTIVVS